MLELDYWRAEATPRVSGVQVTGILRGGDHPSGHPDLVEGKPLSTSRVVMYDPLTRTITTENRQYRLLRPKSLGWDGTLRRLLLAYYEQQYDQASGAYLIWDEKVRRCAARYESYRDAISALEDGNFPSDGAALVTLQTAQEDAWTKLAAADATRRAMATDVARYSHLRYSLMGL